MPANPQVSVDDLIALDAEVWFSTYAVIKNKAAKIIQAPKPNILQKRMFEHYRKCQAKGEPCKMVVLKPRQKGASTCSQAIIYHHYNRYKDLNGSLMGDIAGTSDKVFDIFRRFAENDKFQWNNTPPKLKNNLAELIELMNGSTYGKETAGSKNAGRSGTIQCGNMTEVAFWNTSGHTDPALAYLQSLYDEEEMSLCIADSTPNGPSGWFYNTCMDAMNKTNEWKFIFAAWFEFEDSVYFFKTPEEEEEFEESMTDDEVQEKERYDLTNEQMNWRRRIIRDKCEGNVDKFRQEYPSDPLECFLLSSRPRFNTTCLTEMGKAVTRPNKVILSQQDSQSAVTMVPDNHGPVQVWEEPVQGNKYLISVDTCTGEDQQIGGISADPDYHSVQVWRAAYMDHNAVWYPTKLVALHHSRLDTNYLADEVQSLSAWYGNCLVIPEVNNSGLALVKFLQERGVNMYKRRKYDDVAKMTLQAYGWDTNRQLRKTIIDELARAVLEGEIVILSDDVLKEFRSFIVNKKGRPEAAPNHHDDHVLGAAIAVYNIDAATEYRKNNFRRYNRQRNISPTRGCPDGFSTQRLDMQRMMRNTRFV